MIVAFALFSPGKAAASYSVAFAFADNVQRFFSALAISAVTGFRFSVLEKQLELYREKNPGAALRLNSDEIPENVRKSFLRSTLLDRLLELVDILQIDLILCDVSRLLLLFAVAVSRKSTRLVPTTQAVGTRCMWERGVML